MAGIAAFGGSTPGYGGQYRTNTLPAGSGAGIVLPYQPAPQRAAAPPPPAPMPMPAPMPAPQAYSGGGGSSGPSLTFGGNSFTNVYNTSQQAAPAMQEPSMQQLASFGAGEGLREGLQREGWAGDPMTELDMPGGRSLPMSSRALATVAGRQGRVY